MVNMDVDLEHVECFYDDAVGGLTVPLGGGYF